MITQSRLKVNLQQTDASSKAASVSEIFDHGMLPSTRAPGIRTARFCRRVILLGAAGLSPCQRTPAQSRIAWLASPGRSKMLACDAPRMTASCALGMAAFVACEIGNA